MGAVASILHRLSGLLLVLAVPAALGLAEYSSRSAPHFRWVAGLLDTRTAALLGAVLLAALVHHLLAGIRLMLMDVGVGVGLAAARRSAQACLLVAAVSGLLGLAALWPAGGGHGG